MDMFHEAMLLLFSADTVVGSSLVMLTDPSSMLTAHSVLGDVNVEDPYDIDWPVFHFHMVLGNVVHFVKVKGTLDSHGPVPLGGAIVHLSWICWRQLLFSVDGLCLQSH